MNCSGNSTNGAGLVARLEGKAQELDTYAQTTTSRIVRAVSQGQAQILRELAVELSNDVAT